MVYLILSIIILIVIAYFTFKPKPLRDVTLHIDLAKFLENEVLFYKKLNEEQRKKFQKELIYFLSIIKITGVDVKITDEDKVLVAAAAIVPIFHFEHWFYPNLKEVLIYSSGFNVEFKVGQKQPIQGMVGNRFLNNKMLLSIRALHSGFANKTDKNNTAIHEFIHLIDEADGAVDGIPEVFMKDKNILPWVDLMYQKIKEIKENDSDIDPYGASNEAEFLSVTAEYFFERPNLFKTKHPELYQILEDTFKVK